MKSNSATRMKHSWEVPTDLSGDAVVEISGALRKLLADVFALYVKTKNFHWHMSGKHFRDYHLLLDEQASQVFAMTDDIAERARKLGGTTIHSIRDIAEHQQDNNAEYVSRPRTCWSSFVTTTSSSHESYVPPISSANSMTTSPPPA